MIRARFQFDEFDADVDVPDSFIADVDSLLTQGAITLRGVENLVRGYARVMNMSSEETRDLDGMTIAVVQEQVVYASHAYDDVMDWLATHEFEDTANMPLVITGVQDAAEDETVAVAVQQLSQGDRSRLRVIA